MSCITKNELGCAAVITRSSGLNSRSLRSRGFRGQTVYLTWSTLDEHLCTILR
uniref:Uncharacterized protein n=1 Tax=Helianthus annuus TaxID=4232 RepID=A0A251TP17_HELAN